MKGRRADRRGRSVKGPAFVQLYRYLMESEAWKSLNPYERCAYIAVVSAYNGANNGSIGMGVRAVAERGNMNKDTAGKALATLIERGFIECVTPGGFSRKTRHATEWRLTSHACDKTRMPGSKAFMAWRPTADHGPTRQTVRSDQTGQLTSILASTVRSLRTVNGD